MRYWININGEYKEATVFGKETNDTAEIHYVRVIKTGEIVVLNQYVYTTSAMIINVMNDWNIYLEKNLFPRQKYWHAAFARALELYELLKK